MQFSDDLNVTATDQSVSMQDMEENQKKVRGYYQQLNCYFMCGTAYVKLGRFERAVYPMTRCTEIMPQNYKYFYERAKVYQNLQMFEEAVADYTTVLESNPNLAQAWFRRAFANKALHKFELAIADFEKARQIDPLNPQYNVNHRFLKNVNFLPTAQSCRLRPKSK